MNPESDLSAFILAGGKSSRMGTDKAFVTLGGRTLLERALEAARSVACDVRIVGDPAKFGAFAPVVEDIFSGCGPLGGIHAALRSSGADLNLILAVDVPFVTPALLEFLVTCASSAPSATVTVVRSDDGWQPLCAVYRLAFANSAESGLRQSHYKIDAVFDAARTRVITEEELQSAGFSLQLFRNLNTPQELREAERNGVSHFG